MIQPSAGDETADPSPELCRGRLRRAHRPIRRDRRRALLSDADGRRAVPIVKAETADRTPYRIASADYSAFAEDFDEGAGEAAVDRDGSDRRPARLRRGQRIQGRLGRHQEGVERGAGQRAVDDEPLRRRGKSRRCWRPPTSSRAPRCWSRSRHRARARPGRGDADSLGGRLQLEFVIATTLGSWPRGTRRSRDRTAPARTPGLLRFARIDGLGST